MKKIIALLAIYGLCVNLNAQEFRAYGSKSVGMGGVGVASARDAYSGYYNPALIGVSDYYVDVAILGADASASEGGFTNSVQRIKDLDLYKVLGSIKDSIPRLTIDQNTQTATLSGQFKDYQILNKGIGVVNDMSKQQLLVVLSPHASVQIARTMAVGLYGEISTSGATTSNPDANTFIVENPAIDAQKANLGATIPKALDDAIEKYRYVKINKDTGNYERATKKEYEQNSFVNAMIGKDPSIQAKVAITGIFDIPVSYATSYNLFNLQNDFRFGGSLKGIFITQSMDKLKLNEAKDFSLPSAQSAFTFGLDLGGAYVFNSDDLSDGLTLALVAKNLNSPSATLNNHTLTIDPQIRFGVAYPMWSDTLEVALDYDITDNKLTESKYTAQYLAMGVDYEPFSWIGVRAGMKQNMGSNPITDKPIITAGFNFGAKWLQFEGAFGIATEKFKITKSNGNTQELPAYLEGSFAVVSKWGSKYIRKQPKIKRNSRHNKQLNNKANKAQKELKKDVKKLDKKA